MKLSVWWIRIIKKSDQDGSQNDKNTNKYHIPMIFVSYSSDKNSRIK